MVPFSIGTRHTAPSKEHTGRHVAVQKKSLSCLLLLGLGVIPLRGFDQQGLGHASLCSANIPPMATGFNIRPMATVAANIRPMTTVAGCDFGSHRRLCSFESAGRKPDEGSMLIKLASIVEVRLSCHGRHRSDVTGMYIQCVHAARRPMLPHQGMLQLAMSLILSMP